ncbi:MAG: ABC transporter substrate-binding protein [Actinomycetota bacterium]
MTISRRRSTALRALAFGIACVLSLGSCAIFKPQRIAITTQATETLPPQPLGAPTALPGGTGAKTVFIPGTEGRAGNTGCLGINDPEHGIANGVIKLGTIQPMDGPAAQLGRPLYRTTQAYVNMLNARGGINGCRVQLFLQTACINCEPENKLAAKALVEQKHVFAIVNTYMNTYAFGAAMRYLNDHNVPLVQGWTGVGSEDETWLAKQTPWSVYYTIRNEDAVHVYARWLSTVLDQWAAHGHIPSDAAAHPKWVATVALDVPQDRKRSAEFKTVWESMGSGYRVVKQQFVAAQEEAVTRMDSEINGMHDAHAAGVFSASNITMVFGMQAAARQQWKVPWVSKSAWGRAATDNCGSACDGGFTDNNGWGWCQPCADGSGSATPQMQQYIAAMQRYYPDGARYADAQTLGGWIGMMAFEYAASRLGSSLNRPGLIRVLGHLDDFETGIGAPISTSDADHLGMGQTMMLQICHNRFWRATGWLSASGPMQHVSHPGDCDWGW